MSRFIKILDYVEGKPETVIAFALGLALVLLGIYIGGPWYIVDATGVFGAEIHPDVVRVFSAAFYLIPGSAMLYSLVKSKGNRWKSMSAFGMFMAYLFITTLRVLTLGFTPVVWAFPLTLALVAGVLYIAFTRQKPVVKK